MPSPHELLSRLFVYIEEQLKIIDPRGFQITKSGTPRLFPKDLASLPGVSFDIQEEGDHVWLKIDRLEEVPPPTIGTGPYASCVSIDKNPHGTPPRLNEEVIQTLLKGVVGTGQAEDLEAFETQLRSEAEAAVAMYTGLWLEWAAAEKPRRKTISIYGDLFALQHQLHTEQTAKPVEFVWGLGIAAWRLSLDGTTF